MRLHVSKNMNVRKLLVGAAGLAAAASLIGLGAGASFTDTATAYQHIQTGTVSVQVSADGGATYGKSATFVADDNVSGWGTSPKTVDVYLKNNGSLRMIVNKITIEKTGNLPVDVGPVMLNGSVFDNTTLQPKQVEHYTFTYQVNDLGNASMGQEAGLLVTANGVG